MWTQIASVAYSLAVASGWKWPRRVEAWAWNKADHLTEETT